MTSRPISSARASVQQHLQTSHCNSSSPATETFCLYSPLSRWNGRLEIDKQLVYQGLMHPGMLRLAAPWEREEKECERSARALVIEIPKPRLSSIFESNEYEHRSRDLLFMKPILHNHSSVRRLTQALVFVDELREDSRRCFVDGITEAFIGLLIDHQSRSSSGRPKQLPTLTDEQMQACLVYANSKIDQVLSVEEWARALNFSKEDFSRRFQRRTAETPYSWFMQRRIAYSEELLRDTNIPVAELALSLGFSSQSHFTEAFRRRTGLAPVRWRLSQKQKV